MMKLKMNKHFIAHSISILFAGALASSLAQATPVGLTYQGRLVKNDLPVESNTVALTVKVTSPGVNECVLYEETHTLNMTNSDGIFSVKIGGGARTVNDEALSLVQVFSNTGSAINGLICGGGATSYTSVQSDSRNIYATFNDGVDTVAFSSPYVIQSVPYALEAERLAGKSASEFIQTTADTTQSKINALTAATPYTELLALIGGTSTQYMTSGSAISTSGNITQTGTGAVTTGTGAIALNGPTTLAANQNFSMASGTGTFAQTFTGTGTASALTANSVTMSAAQSITGNGLTSGSLLSLSSNSTAAANGNKGLDIAISGANGTASITRTGVSSVVTSTGATSTNVGGYFSASGATNNYGLIVANGNVGIGMTTPDTSLTIATTGSTPSTNKSQIKLVSTNGNIGVAGAEDIIGGVDFVTNDLSAYTTTAAVRAIANGNHITPSLPTALTFHTYGTAAPLTERMRITGVGNVGIGTTTPGFPLVVQKTGAGAEVTPLYLRNETAWAAGVKTSLAFGANNTDQVLGKISAVYNTNTISALSFGAWSSSALQENLLYIRGDGNVGIGTTSPDATLQVVSSQNFAYPAADATTGRPSGATTVVRNSANNGTGYAGISFEPRNTRSAYIGATAGSDSYKSNMVFGYRTNTGTLSETMRIHENGNLGIGTASPTTKLHVVGASGATIATFADGGATTCTVTPASTGFACSSDERLKKNIEPFSDFTSLEKVLQLRTVTYDWRTVDNGKHTGYIAQEMEKIAPEFVRTGEDGYKQVNYTGLVPWITGAIRAFYAEFKIATRDIASARNEAADAKAESAALRSQNQQLIERLDQQEKELAAIKRKLGL